MKKSLPTIKKLTISRIYCTAVHELKYWIRVIKVVEIARFIIYSICIVIVNFSDTQSFFLDKDSVIPADWGFLKVRSHIVAISVAVILLITIIDAFGNKKKNKELFEVIRNHILPSINAQLEDLKTDLTEKYHFAKNLRLSIFVPVRLGFFDWRLQMICHTENIHESEREASFELNEGVIGYIFLKTKKLYVENVPLVFDNGEKIYNELSSENYNLISKRIKCITSAATFQKSIAGLLSIDTDNIKNIEKMGIDDFHKDALNWVIKNRSVMTLLWRSKNNV